MQFIGQADVEGSVTRSGVPNNPPAVPRTATLLLLGTDLVGLSGVGQRTKRIVSRSQKSKNTSLRVSYQHQANNFKKETML